VIFGIERERIHAKTIGGSVAVVLPGLDVVEIIAISFGKAIMAVKLEEATLYGVFSSIHVYTIVIILASNYVISRRSLA
jgi:hypothetical protein